MDFGVRLGSKRLGAVLLASSVGALIILAITLHVKSDDGRFHNVAFATVAVGDITHSISSSGQLKPLVSVEVSSQLSGLVSEVLVDFNSPVKKGAVLARLDASTFEQKLHQADADLSAAFTSRELASLDLRRMKDLRTQDLVTQQSYDQAAAVLRQAQAALLTRRALVANARLDLERCAITSPVDGVVIFKQIEVGRTVAASLSAPTLFVIAQDLSKMQIVAPINEVDVSSVSAGQRVEFTVDALPGREFYGRVVQIRSPYTPSDQRQTELNPGRVVTFDVVVEVDNNELLLRPELTANVAIVVRRRNRVLLVPNNALRQAFDLDAGAPVGLGPAQGVAYRKVLTGTGRTSLYRSPLRIGISDGINTEIVDGLSEGDIVATGTVTSREASKRTWKPW